MNTDLSNLTEVIQFFTDGNIIDFYYDDDSLVLKFYIPEKAKCSNPDFSHFYLKLFDYEGTHYEPYKGDIEEINDFYEIFNLNLRVINALKRPSFVEITTSIGFFKDDPFNGGDLIICAKGFILYDEVMKEVSMNEMRKILNTYWQYFLD